MLRSNRPLERAMKFAVRDIKNNSVAVDSVFENVMPSVASGSTDFFASSTNSRDRLVEREKFGTVDFYSTFSIDQVKQQISSALKDLKTSDGTAIVSAVRACGSSWYDTSYRNKNAVLDRFLDNYLHNTPMSSSLACAVLKTSVENKKAMDSKEYLTRLLSLGVQPDSGIYCAMAELECVNGNFDAALSIFNFMKNKSLPMSRSMLVNLIASSVSSDNLDASPSLLDALRASGGPDAFLQKFALAVGYAKLGDLKSMDETLPFKSQQPVQAQLLLYKELVEGSFMDQSSDYLTQAMSEDCFNRPQMFDTVAAHLFANSHENASLELISLLAKSNSNQIWNSNYIRLINSVLAKSEGKNAKPVLEFCKQLENQGIVSQASALAVGRAIRVKKSNFRSLLDLFIQESSPVRKHMLLPWIKSQGSFTVDSVTKLGESLESSHFSASDSFCRELLRLFKSNSEYTEFLTSSEKAKSYPKLLSFLTRYYIETGQWSCALEHCKSFEIGRFEADNIMFAVSEALKLDDINPTDAAHIISRCCEACADDKGMLTRFIRETISNIDSNMTKYTFFALARCLSELKCYARESPILPGNSFKGLFSALKSEDWAQKSRMSVQSTISLIAAPELFLQESSMAIVLKENQDVASDLLEKVSLMEDNFRTRCQSLILKNCTGNFTGSESAIESNQEDLKTMPAELFNVFLTSLIPDRIDLAVASVQLRGNVSSRATQDVIEIVVSEEHMEALMPIVLASDARPRAAKAFLHRLKDLGMEGLLKRAAASYYESTGSTYGDLVCTDLLSTTDLRKALDYLTECRARGMEELPSSMLISACIEAATEEAKEVLKQVLAMTKNHSQFVTGIVVLQYIAMGQYDKAVKFAEGKDFFFVESNVALKLFDKEPEALVTYLRILHSSILPPNVRDRKMQLVLDKLGKLLQENSSLKKTRVRDFMAAIVNSDLRFSHTSGLTVYNLAANLGVEVPQSFKKMHNSLSFQFRDAVLSDNLELCKEILKVQHFIRVDSITLSRFVEQLLFPVIVTLEDELIDFLVYNKQWFIDHPSKMAQLFAKCVKNEQFEKLLNICSESPESKLNAFLTYCTKLFDVDTFCTYICQELPKEVSIAMHMRKLVTEVVLQHPNHTICDVYRGFLSQPESGERENAIELMEAATERIRGQQAIELLRQIRYEYSTPLNQPEVHSISGTEECEPQATSAASV